MTEQARADADAVAVATAQLQGERLVTVEVKVDGLISRFDKIEPKVDLLVERSASWQGATSAIRGLIPFVAVGVSIAALVLSLGG